MIIRGVVICAVTAPATIGLGARSAEAVAPASCHAHRQVLADLGGPQAGIGAFNDRGVYVGSATPAGLPTDESLAVYWDSSGIHVIPTGLLGDFAGDINHAGEIVGAGTDPLTGAGRSWAFVGGQVRFLADLGGGYSEARRINSSGAIGGFAVDAKGNGFAVRWSSWSALPVELGPAPGDVASVGHGINDSGEVAGETVTPAGAPRPAIWDQRGHVHVLPSLPGFPYGLLRVDNNRSEAAGDIFNDGGSVVHAARWDRNGAVHDLGTLPGDTGAEAFGMSPNGSIVGDSLLLDAQGNIVNGHVIFWPGHGPLLALPGLSGSYATDGSNAHAVSDDETVGGTSVDPGGTWRATVWFCAEQLAIQPQPAPASSSSRPTGSDALRAASAGPSLVSMRNSAPGSPRAS